jgi:hypothetical protein
MWGATIRLFLKMWLQAVVKGGHQRAGHSTCATPALGIRLRPIKSQVRMRHLVYNKEAAVLYPDQHNDSNILVLGSKFVDDAYDDGHHQHAWLSADLLKAGVMSVRTDQIKAIEKEFFQIIFRRKV